MEVEICFVLMQWRIQRECLRGGGVRQVPKGGPNSGRVIQGQSPSREALESQGRVQKFKKGGINRGRC